MSKIEIEWREPERPPMTGDMIEAVAFSFGVTVGQILNGGRHEPVASARKTAMVLAYAATGDFKEAGKPFRRNRQTVRHALNTTPQEYIDAVLNHRSITRLSALKANLTPFWLMTTTLTHPTTQNRPTANPGATAGQPEKRA